MQKIGMGKWPASACCFVIDVHLTGKATGGREPRIVSLATSRVSPDGTVLALWHGYIKTDVPADPAFVSNVHGHTYLELQALAKGSFAQVGAEWIRWLRDQLGHHPGTASAMLVTGGGLKANVYTSLLAELARAELVLPRSVEWLALDLVHAARKQKTYASVAVGQWANRQKPTEAQRRAGQTPPPELTLANICLYELQTASKSIEELCGPDAARDPHATAKMAAVVLGAFGARRRLVGKTVALPLHAMVKWAKRLVQYEQARREDTPSLGTKDARRCLKCASLHMGLLSLQGLSLQSMLSDGGRRW